MLAVKNLRVEFGPRVIFKDLTFSIRDKERIAFAGHKGAGKSTLMKCLGGVLQQNGGFKTLPLKANSYQFRLIGWSPAFFRFKLLDFN